LLIPASLSVSAADFANDAFARTWARTDKPVADLVVNRTWMWGNEAFTGEITETYAQAPGGNRKVQYFDKSRMEINHDSRIPVDSPWHVTNGLLVVELMTGRLQLGDNTFDPKSASEALVAGDQDQVQGVTYRFMSFLRDEPADPVGRVINRILTPGAATNMYLFSDRLGGLGITATRYVPETDHTVASVFWEFMTSWGTVHEGGQFVNDQLFLDPFYATGLPITEAYWANVKLAGVQTDVLVQCFERRCLTYTPSNPEGWKVEAGNVGQHYYSWRYGGTEGQPPADPNEPNQLSYWYVYPDRAAYDAIKSFCGCEPALNGATTKLLMERAWARRHLYNLVTANLGHFNAHTDNYYEWQKQYISTYLSPDGDSSYFRDVREKAETQVYTAIYDGDSQIGVRIRKIENGLDPLFDDLGISGPEVYWHYLIDPWIQHSTLGNAGRQAAEGRFKRMSTEYFNSGYLGSFGDYLASRGYRII
jgi:hypothetical protein